MRTWLRILVVWGLFAGLLGVVGVGGASGAVGVVDAPAVGVACADVPSRGFVDVSDGNVHKGSIDCVAFYGVSIGCGSGEGFCPDDRVTRWQVALFLARVADLAGVVLGTGSGSAFEDLDGLPSEAVTAVRRLAEAGVIKGSSETVFNPYGLVSRGQMALLLVRFLALVPTSGVFVGADGTVSVNGVEPDDFFEDVSSWPVEFDQAAGALFELGIARGRAGGGFGPSLRLTRAQMASFLARMLNHVDLSGGGGAPIGGPGAPLGPVGPGPGPVVPPPVVPTPPTDEVPPVAASGRLSNLLLNERQVARVDLARPGAEVFEGGDSRGLTYRASSSNSGVASVSLDGPVVEVSAGRVGTANVTVSATGSSGSASSSFSVRVTAGVDYDADGDGLLEISTLAQLDGIRLDLNGDGNADDDSNKETFDKLYPDAIEAKGCPATGCVGYELTADLDFDTNGDGGAGLGDDYWNDGKGWVPIGPFPATFDGNNHTISGLFINVSNGSTDSWGLFSKVTSAGEVRGVRLSEAAVSVNISRSSVGLLVGELNGVVRRSSAAGSVDSDKADALVGGLVGFVNKDGSADPLLADSWALVIGTGGGICGGLVGRLSGGVIERSYAVGTYHTTVGSSSAPDVGGLVGYVGSGTLRQVYAVTDVSVAPASASGEVGGLVGAFAGGTGGEAFAAGAVLGSNADAGTQSKFGGLVGITSGGGIAATGVYWDTEATGQAIAGVDRSDNPTNGTGLTTAAIRADTETDVSAPGYDGVFKDWDNSVWDFGTSSQYPALVADFNGDGVATWQEFGNQRHNGVRKLRNPPDVNIDRGEELLVGPTVFQAPNAEGLTFSGSAVNTSIVTVTQSNTGIIVTGVAAGTTKVTITARDATGEELSEPFDVTVSAMVDYDSDDDGLIEVSSLEQLNAIRWDLDGNGQPGAANQTDYTTAFPSPVSGMGCPSSGCSGYELTADLDFDTNDDGEVGEGDTYWDGGKGWVPLGDLASIFDGNGHTIDGLSMNVGATGNAGNWGLFESITTSGVVHAVGLTGVDLSVAQDKARVGALAGINQGLVQRVFAQGKVVVSGADEPYVGGLLGAMDGSAPEVSDSYSTVNVTASVGRAGGLLGHSDGGKVVRSYATGDVSSPASTTTTFRSLGGLLGYIRGGSLEYVYASGAVSVPNNAGAHAGGLVGRASTGDVHESLAVGAIGAAGSVKRLAALGGLIGTSTNNVPELDFDAYWNSTTLVRSATVQGGTPKTTAELQADSNSVVAGATYSGIYRRWDHSVWDFGTSSQYPVLVVDFDGDGTATWQEFGDQRASTTVEAYGEFDDLQMDLGEIVVLSPAGVFRDRDGGALTFSASATGTAVGVSVDGALVSVTASAAGDSTVQVTARDRSGRTASDSFDVTVSAKTDYDADGDGLIEVANMAQLNAIRWDLDGNGKVATGDQATYDTAFPNAANEMGCPPVACSGYELTADLDFDSDGDGDVDGDDHSGSYWNTGKGWSPIGPIYTATFDGNNHTISNLFIDVDSLPAGGYGLFAEVSHTGAIRGVRLEKVSITAKGSSPSVGSLAGIVKGSVTRSSAAGTVSSGESRGNTGGLVGVLEQDTANGGAEATIEDSFALVDVSGNGVMGGLVGRTTRTQIRRVYTNGNVTVSGDPSSTPSAGGIVGHFERTQLLHAYVLGDVDGTVVDKFVNTGGILGYLDRGDVKEAFTAGFVTPEQASISNTILTGGLVGHVRRTGISRDDTYYDLDVNNQIDRLFLSLGESSLGRGATTNDLRVATVNTSEGRGVYEDWTPELWDFGTARQYPVLVVDFNGDGVASWQEFGNQRDDRTVRKVRDAPDITVDTGESELVGPEVFHAPNAEGLRFSGTSESSAVARVRSTTAGIVVTGVAAGTTNVTISATDSQGTRLTDTFAVTVTATVASATIDYDTDGDRLIEISNLAQLDAVRFDVSGIGYAPPSNTAAYQIAFPNPAFRMGCENFCLGYELTRDLDFDSNRDGRITATDNGGDYWNDGKGWEPIASYNGVFEGNGYTISNLYIDRTASEATGYFGLFARLINLARVRDVGVVDASVTVTASGTAIHYVGVLAGGSSASIQRVHTTGAVEGSGATMAVGGLVGTSLASTAAFIEDSYSTASVTATKWGGGLVGVARRARIVGSYATGTVTGKGSTLSGFGGLIGEAQAYSNSGELVVESSYATGTVTGSETADVSIGGLIGSANLVTVRESYALSPLISRFDDTNVGGLIGLKTSATVVDSDLYWNPDTTRADTSAGGTAKTARELRADTLEEIEYPGYDGIYKDWNSTYWDFGTSHQYPVLKADTDGDLTATWQEFGDQRPTTRHAPVAIRSLPKITMLPAGSRTIRLGGSEAVFADANFDPLTYTVTSSEPSMAAATLSSAGTSVVVAAGELGKSLITVTATDPGGLSASVVFEVTVRNPIDYDADGDGLIEVGSVAQLHAMRWDLDGNGVVGSGDQDAYAEAFPLAAAAMGCPPGGCSGYELTVDLNFDSNGDNVVDEQDHDGAYWNSGAGWAPIGGTYNATFQGNGHAISRLTINRTSNPSPTSVGFFAELGADSRVLNLGLDKVDIQVRTGTRVNTSIVFVGSLAGRLLGVVDQAFVTGRIRGTQEGRYIALEVGGLVGFVRDAHSPRGIYRSYVLLDVVLTTGYSIGGFASTANGVSIESSYSLANLLARDVTRMGGIAPAFFSSQNRASSSRASWVAGTFDHDLTPTATNPGGLAASVSVINVPTVTDSYWDTERTGVSGSRIGEGKTTSELQTDTNSRVRSSSYEGIYKDWDTSEWDFGTSSQYPALSVDFDGDGTATWQEYGDQRFRQQPQVVNPMADITLDMREPADVALLTTGNRVFSDWTGDAYTYSATSSSTSTATVSVDRDTAVITVTGVRTGTATITVTARNSVGLSASHTFDVTVSDKVDYDSDNDGLIDVYSVEQLDAIRWDTNGDGELHRGVDPAPYRQAFPDPTTDMGCRSGGCNGYELIADLSLDTNRNGRADSGDTFWNNGAGWAPIVTLSSGAIFDGNGHTISDLFINRSVGRFTIQFGLFNSLGGEVRDLGLVDVAITVSGTSNISGPYVGALAGSNFGVIRRVFSTGSITVNGLNDTRAGGLVGEQYKTPSASVTPTIEDSYSTVALRARGRAGGLVGRTFGSRIIRSYATGSITAVDATATRYWFGGVAGFIGGDTLESVWASGSVTVPKVGNGHGGGLVGHAEGGTIKQSFAVGAVRATGTDGTGGGLGGLVGSSNTDVPTISADVYFNSTTTGQTESLGRSDAQNPNAGGTAKTTSELQSDTDTAVNADGYTGIYKDWTHTTWDYRGSRQYPALKVDFNQDGTATWQEFGNQR